MEQSRSTLFSGLQRLISKINIYFFLTSFGFSRHGTCTGHAPPENKKVTRRPETELITGRRCEVGRPGLTDSARVPPAINPAAGTDDDATAPLAVQS